MRPWLYLLLPVCVLFISGNVLSQSSKLTVAKEPAWITKNNIDYTKTSLDKNAEDGYIDISYENQVSLADQSEYRRRSKKIISQSGVQNASEISISFDPSYQQLIFHTIRIIRNGETLNKLQLSNFKLIHQEKELSDFIYNGSLNALLILDDVRKGDIIEYSYTLRGFNPIFKNKYAEEFDMDFSTPVYQIYCKLIVPQGRKMNIKNINGNITPAISSLNGQQVYEWKKDNSAPVILQDYTPSWYQPYSEILVSEYNNWKEVNDWAMELFPNKKELSASLQKKIKEIETTNNGDAERTKAALRFVQDDIRYMGIEMGENSHRPADPSKVFAQRFGDCKEKSYLLCQMLRAMDIEASPVLINTNDKKKIVDYLPSYFNFDHVTVRVKLDGAYYWFDPTISYQRGDIKNLFYPDYQVGLVITDTTTDLTNIQFRKNSDVHIQEFFKTDFLYGSGKLSVTTVFRGNEADNMRENFNEQSISELMTGYQKFYAGYFEDIKADSLTYEDNDSTGLFTTKEYYSIPHFWTTGKNNKKEFSFSLFNITGILRQPKDKNRTMPFRLTFPAKFTEQIIIDLPEDWEVTEATAHLKNACFAYNSRFYNIYNKVKVDADYENYKDNVTVNESPEYFKDVAQYYDNENFVISPDGTNAVEQKSSHSSNSNILSMIAVIALVIGGIVWITQRK